MWTRASGLFCGPTGKIQTSPMPDHAMEPPCAGSPRNASSRGSFCGRDGACQTPSYWSTRNRSFGMHHPAFTKGSALPVLMAQALKKLPVERHRVCCPVGHLSIDRFLVLQYEGKRQMPNRAYFANSVSVSAKPKPKPKPTPPAGLNSCFPSAARQNMPLRSA